MQEGESLDSGQTVGRIDTQQLELRKAQLLASKHAVRSRAPDVSAQLSAFGQQIAVQQQRKNLLREQERAQNLVSAGPAPTKQLLVYALKVAVKNDGGLKIGMPGEVRFVGGAQTGRE